MELTDEAIIYQLEKVDQGGEVSDIFEDRMSYLAEEWGYEIDYENYGIALPDGRVAYLRCEAVIYDPKQHVEKTVKKGPFSRVKGLLRRV